MSGWDRLAGIYDLAMAPLERFWFGRCREAAAWRAGRGRILEIGAGTGASFCCIAREAGGVATDASWAMLRRAQQRPDRPARMSLAVADAQQLPFKASTFDAALATLVLCNVDDPPRALAEVRRVVRPGGRLVAFEHVRPDVPPFGLLFDAINAVTAPLFHEHFNRRTVETIAAAGFRLISVVRRPMMRLVVAEP